MIKLTKIYRQVIFIWLIALQSVWGQNPFAQKATFEGLYQGKFDGEQVEVLLSSTGEGYEGHLTLGKSHYEIIAELKAGQLIGRYVDVDNQATPLLFKLHKDTLVIARRGGDINLKKKKMPTDVWGKWTGKDIEIFINQEAQSKRVSGIIFYAKNKYAFHGAYSVGVLSAQFRKGKLEPYSCSIKFVDDEHAIFESAVYSEKIKRVDLASQSEKELVALLKKTANLGLLHSHSHFTQYKKKLDTLRNELLDLKKDIHTAISQQSALSLASFMSSLPKLSSKIIALTKERSVLINTPVIPLVWDRIEPFSEGLAVVKQGGKYGFINQEGKVISEVKWTDARSFSQGLALVSDGNKYGFIDKTGKVALPLQWQNAWPFSEGLAAVLHDGKWGFIDLKGAVVIKPIWGDTTPFKNGLSRVKRIGMRKFGFIDKTGKEVIEVKWDFAGTFASHPDVAAIGSDKKYGLITRGGVVTTQLEYTNRIFISEEMAIIYKDKKWGALRADGPVAITPKYARILPCSDGCFAVKEDKKWGFISKSGKWLVKPYWDDVRSFKEGVAPVKKAGKWGLINKEGRTLVSPRYEATRLVLNGSISVQSKGKWGVISTKGIWVVNPVWDDLGGEYGEYEAEQMLPVKRNGKWGVIALPML